MSNSQTDENIMSHLTEYQENLKELKTIQRDIRDYRKKYDRRIKSLKDSLEKNERVIMAYMKMNNHPGINFKGLLITLSTTKTGTRTSVKQKEKNVNDILRKHNVEPTNPLFSEIKKIFINDTEKEKIKLMKLNK